MSEARLAPVQRARPVGGTRCLRRAPAVSVGLHCDSPRRCPLHEVCWRDMPPTNVFTLYRGGKKASDLFNTGMQEISDVPAAVRLTTRQQIQRTAVISRRPQVNGPALQRFLGRLAYPLALLDFEAFATAVPLFDGLRPYQQVPFQFSCHVAAQGEAEPEARGWIWRDAGDPRPEFMAALRRQLPAEGSIVVYNAGFEVQRLAECAEFLPKSRRWVAGLRARFVDLLEPFREFHYYHPDQHGSASIKAVLPALTGRSYDDLAIRDGATAAQRYLEVTFGKAGRAERERVWADLDRYCGRDTMAMLWVLEALQRLVPRGRRISARTSTSGSRVRPV
jgi:hypothetical protein